MRRGCLILRMALSWRGRESRAANGCRKDGPTEITETKEGKYDSVKLQKPEASISRGKEWSAVPTAAEKVKD